ncbi:DUF3558 family protein [Jiangella sp. DSM 45060]|uniref:DUF3558 family protein n=1 Tax=Jiangella sp. DSM 45060 TaxID=1798224 RepID=UPI00087BB0F4|nr:DUF3558 family protein [Jiangella sp. DSM 45060]SDS65113.1 Protein of unknown function [Jiangella sp. DSM 45060]
MPRIPAAAAAVLLLLTGCGGDDDPAGDAPTATGPATGEPSAVPSEPSAAPSEPSASPSPGGDDTGLAALDPCAMADAAALASLGLTGGEAKELGEARVCRYRLEGATLDESFTVSIELFDGLGAADIVATDVQPLPPVGTHEAVTFTGTTGGCVVSLAVTETSRLDSTAVGGDPALACDHAAALAALAEPALP